jgi:sterol-4alpha-carboxylate 3-dehydrogenase (decarboxylating)
LGTIIDFFCFLLYPIKEIDPNLSRFKVRLTAAHRYYNISKARRILGYEPRVSLDAGIRRSVEWFTREELIKQKVISEKKHN